MAVSLFACGGDDDDESAGTSTTASDSPTSASGDGETTVTTDEQGTSTTNTSTEPCGETGSWSTEPEQVLAASADPIYLLDAGRHDAPQCYDQLSFRLNGTGAVGYYVGYYADGSDVRVEGDQLVTTAGDAALVVDISAPVQGGPFDQSGHQPMVIFAETVGQALYPASNPTGLKVIKEVRFAGELEAGSAGSVASFAVGVDRQRPFAVNSFVDEDTNTRVIVIRIAH